MPAGFHKPDLSVSPGAPRLGLVALPWHLDRRGERLGAGPEAILAAGLPAWLRDAGCEVDGPHVIELTEEERRQYGAWHKVGLHGAHLAQTVAELRGGIASPWRCSATATARSACSAGCSARAPNAWG